MLGISALTGKVPLYTLDPIVAKVKTAKANSPLSKEIFPKSVGGDEVKLILGVKDSLLMPILLMILPNAIQVCRSRIKDIFGSSIIFAGPHPNVADVYRKH